MVQFFNFIRSSARHIRIACQFEQVYIITYNIIKYFQVLYSILHSLHEQYGKRAKEKPENSYLIILKQQRRRYDERFIVIICVHMKF